MKGFNEPFFISLRESAPFGSLATLRDRGLTRRLVRSDTLYLREGSPKCPTLIGPVRLVGRVGVGHAPILGGVSHAYPRLSVFWRGCLWDTLAEMSRGLQILY